MTYTDPIPPLFRTAPHNGTPTSKAAAKSIEPFLTQQAARVLRSIQSHPGCTREAVALSTGMLLSAVCGRVHQLVKDGHVVERGTAKTSTGRSAACLYAVQQQEKVA